MLQPAAAAVPRLHPAHQYQDDSIASACFSPDHDSLRLARNAFFHPPSTIMAPHGEADNGDRPAKKLRAAAEAVIDVLQHEDQSEAHRIFRAHPGHSGKRGSKVSTARNGNGCTEPRGGGGAGAGGFWGGATIGTRRPGLQRRRNARPAPSWIASMSEAPLTVRPRARWLRRARDKLGLSRKALAAAAGLSPSTLDRKSVV